MAIATLKGKHVDVALWAPLEEVESEALTQLRNITALPWVFKHVAAMPDVHFGKGATVGSVIAMKDAVSPAAVGVDIGCGMAAVETSLSASYLPESLDAIRSAVEAVIPVGHESHDVAPKQVKKHALFGEFDALDPKVASSEMKQKAMRQLGTLGGGNHFIELCLDTKQRVWLMLHSGSRNIGKTLAEVHIARARKLAHNAALPDPDLAVFLAGTPEMAAYRHDLFWAQRYAFANRERMLEVYEDVLRDFFPAVSFRAPILCHHNYVAEETHFGEDVLVTRKGAIRAGKGELGIIPGSMGTRSYIVRGLGNPESFESASHGAGRRMSRGQAKKRFNLRDLAAQTEGVACRKDAGVLDEIPGAYKDIDHVMAQQQDLVEVVAELKQVMCVKG
ncbi:MAG: RtcB family protein [Deltaproteobacteria bacterium]|nr:RtcB family protein [Deltaproteobacteria bacterium]